MKLESPSSVSNCGTCLDLRGFIDSTSLWLKFQIISREPADRTYVGVCRIDYRRSATNAISSKAYFLTTTTARSLRSSPPSSWLYSSTNSGISHYNAATSDTLPGLHAFDRAPTLTHDISPGRVSQSPRFPISSSIPGQPPQDLQVMGYIPRRLLPWRSIC